MILNNTQIFMIEALGGVYKKKSLKSFSNTFRQFNLKNIQVIKEKKTREETLNVILKKRDKNMNLFFFVDDIIFLSGWHRSLQKKVNDKLIIGFSMLNPKGQTIQDFGYDFIKLDGEVTYKGLHKGDLVRKVKLPTHRSCSAVCGCAMWVGKKVLKKVNQFPLEGNNRWGEMLYSSIAKKKGFKTLVLSSHLIHHGTSTKIKKDILLSSNSWLIERDMWKKISKKFFSDLSIKKEIHSNFSAEFSKSIKSIKKLLIYGCGTVADIVTKKYHIQKKTDYASNLKEEIGKKFYDKKIKNFKKINYLRYDKIFISSVGYEKKIIKEIPIDQRNKTICIKKSIAKNKIFYSLCNYKFF
jgi:GT2 family glycosyltransferase